ncbi:hypothetical protein EE612_037754 [Oryza sativa]|nr:hypothetical protein EE612_037754 [Oryza sativa]
MFHKLRGPTPTTQSQATVRSPLSSNQTQAKHPPHRRRERERERAWKLLEGSRRCCPPCRRGW